ncbi:hypothetical protein AB6A40_006758 [Gnathostoma spinigerum]|uniref:Transmembrane protein n=1 Tax=Gnathostoma spinigerum TaxID=75299 RepID=A0ABD6EPF8_9BILA
MELENENVCFCCLHVQRGVVTVASVLSIILFGMSTYMLEFAVWNVNLIFALVLTILLLPTTSTAVVTAVTKATLIARPFMFLCYIMTVSVFVCSFGYIYRLWSTGAFERGLYTREKVFVVFGPSSCVFSIWMTYVAVKANAYYAYREER